jgi:DNA-binding IclR family transcriptional regulator
MPAEAPRILSVDAALDVAESFLSSPGGISGVTDIARQTGLQKNRVWRILNTLVARGYVQQDVRTGQYSLGPGFLVLGEAFRDRLDLRRLAQPLLSEMADVTGDAAFLFVPFGRAAVCTDMRTGRHTVQALASLGESIPLHIGASPKVLLAFKSQSQRAEIMGTMGLERYTPATITDRGELLEEIDRIRANGYCVAEDDYELGANAVGAPVRDHTGQVVAALSLAVPHIRYDEQRRQQSIGLVLAASMRLSQMLGFSAPFARRERGATDTGSQTSEDADSTRR